MKKALIFETKHEGGFPIMIDSTGKYKITWSKEDRIYTLSHGNRVIGKGKLIEDVITAADADNNEKKVK